MTRAEEAASRRYMLREITPENVKLRSEFIQGYEQAEKDIISIIESRIGEILGDAQPAPILRAELNELIKRIKQ